MRNFFCLLLFSAFLLAALPANAGGSVIIYSHQALLFKASVGGRFLSKNYLPFIYFDINKKGTSKLKVKLTNGIVLKVKIDCGTESIYQLKSYRNRYYLKKLECDPYKQRDDS